MSPDAERIRSFITGHFLFDFDSTVTEHSNLFHLGLIDSYGFVELVSFLESEFHITFTEDEIVNSSLNTLANIVEAVRRKTHVHP